MGDGRKITNRKDNTNRNEKGRKDVERIYMEQEGALIA